MNRPIYYSLGKDDKAVVPNLDGRFEPGRIEIVRTGADVALIGLGSIAVEAVAAADILACAGVEATVAVVSGFSPDPVDDVADLLSKFRLAVSVEAQTVSGGLGAFVSTVIATSGLNCRLKVLAVRSSPDGTSGSQAERWRRHGLDRTAIAAAAMP
jgi:transketolase